jgi:hypothetical protein
VVRVVLAAAALLVMFGIAQAQERARHGGLLSGMLPEGRAVNGDIQPAPPPFDGRAGVFDQSQRHCFGQDRQGRRVRVPC